jgi:hypothetical protein
MTSFPQIAFGIEERYIDITNIIQNFLNCGSHFEIPVSDKVRSSMFSDPTIGKLKHTYMMKILNIHSVEIFLPTHPCIQS